LDPTTVTPAPEVLFRDLSGEGVLLNLRSGRYYGLDAVGTRVWQMLAEGRTLASAVAQLLREYDVSREKLETDIACFVEALEIHGLVVRTTGEPEGEPA
jgi:coenzyme PQQ synthesis protein D (PqqD)